MFPLSEQREIILRTILVAEVAIIAQVEQRTVEMVAKSKVIIKGVKIFILNTP